MIAARPDAGPGSGRSTFDQHKAPKRRKKTACFQCFDAEDVGSSRSRLQECPLTLINLTRRLSRRMAASIRYPVVDEIARERRLRLDLSTPSDRPFWRDFVEKGAGEVVRTGRRDGVRSPRSGWGGRRGSGQHLCEAAEVLRGGGEVDFVAYAAGATETESSQAKDALEVGEEDFDLLSQPARLRIVLGRCDGASHVAGRRRISAARSSA